MTDRVITYRAGLEPTNFHAISLLMQIHWRQGIGVPTIVGLLNFEACFSAFLLSVACAKQIGAVNCPTNFFTKSLRPSFSYIRRNLPDGIVLLQLSGILDSRRKTTLNYLKFLEDIGQQDITAAQSFIHEVRGDSMP